MYEDVPESKTRGIQVLISLACLTILVAGLRAAAEVMLPITLGLFLALLSIPLTTWLKNHHIPRGLAVLFAVIVDILIVGGIIYIFSTSTRQFMEQVPTYVSQLQIKGEEAAAWLETKGNMDGAVDAFDNFFDWYGMVQIVKQTEVLQRITSLFSKSFFVLVLMVFILVESGSFSRRVRQIFRARGPNFARFQTASRDIQRYLAIKTLVSLVTGTLAGFLTWAFGLNFFLLWGLLAFLFNYIPVIGSVLAAIPPVFLALVENDTLLPAVGIMIGFLLINIILGNFIEPMLLGRRFGISTVVVILSVIIWGYIWGPMGMFLAVPLTMVVKVMLDNSEDFRWISVAMGKAKGERPFSFADSEGRALEGADNEAAGA